jgi:4'-phosphopantetheinyl transferase
MPIHHSIKINEHIQVIIWHITESLEEMEAGIEWHPSDLNKYQSLKHPDKKREFLGIRYCLIHFLGHNPEVLYHPNGKPFLNQDLQVSFSHTQHYAAVSFSKSQAVGVDLEHEREAISRIAKKFTRPEERLAIEAHHEIDHLLFYWGMKECIVKITGNKKLSFKEDIRIAPFSFVKNGCTTAILRKDDEYIQHTLYFKKLDNLFISFGWQQSL